MEQVSEMKKGEGKQLYSLLRDFENARKNIETAWDDKRASQEFRDALWENIQMYCGVKKKHVEITIKQQLNKK